MIRTQAVIKWTVICRCSCSEGQKPHYLQGTRMTNYWKAPAMPQLHFFFSSQWYLKPRYSEYLIYSLIVRGDGQNDWSWAGMGVNAVPVHGRQQLQGELWMAACWSSPRQQRDASSPGSRSISCTPASMSSCHSPTRALTMCAPACTQLRAWRGILTSQMYAQLCCNGSAVALGRTRKPVAGGFCRSGVAAVTAWQDRGHACSEPWGDLTCAHRLMFPSGWSLVPETMGVLVGPDTCAELSRLPAQSSSGHHYSLQKWAVLWYGLLVSDG